MTTSKGLWLARGVARAEIREAIVASARGLGLEEPDRDGDPDNGDLVLTSIRRPAAILLHALPQHLVYEIRSSEAGFVLRCRSRFRPGYWLSIGLAWTIGLLLIAEGLLSASWAGLSMTETGWRLARVLAGFAVYGFGFRLLSSPRAIHAGHFWLDLRQRLEARGGTLRRLDPGMTRWQGLGALWILAPLLLVLVAFLVGSLEHGIESDRASVPVPLLLLGSLLLTMAALVGGLVLMSRMPGAMGRLTPMLPGVSSLLAGLSLVLVAVPWQVHDDRISTGRPALEALVEYEATGVPSPALLRHPEGPPPREEITKLLGQVRVWGWTCVGGSGAVLVLAGILLLTSLKVVLYSVATLRNYRVDRAADWVRDVTVGRGFLGGFRLAFGGTWLLLGAALWVGVLAAGPPTLRALGLSGGPVDPLGTHQSFDASVMLLSMALFGETHSLLAEVLCRIAWLSHAALVWGLILLSVGTLWWRRRRLRSRLMAARLGDEAEHARLDAIAARLCGRARSPRPRVVLSDEPSAGAWVHGFGLLKRTRIIEVSRSTTRILSPDSIEALLGHEIAHLRRSHGLRDGVMRWLGRLTLTGDSFVRTLRNTVANELSADRVAVKELGVDPRALRDAIWQVRNFNGALGLRRHSMAEGAGLAARAWTDVRLLIASERRALSWRTRLVQSSRLFVDQYVGAGGLTYWHPPEKIRDAQLRELARTPQGSPRFDETAAQSRPRRGEGLSAPAARKSAP